MTRDRSSSAGDGELDAFKATGDVAVNITDTGARVQEHGELDEIRDLQSLGIELGIIDLVAENCTVQQRLLPDRVGRAAQPTTKLMAGVDFDEAGGLDRGGVTYTVDHPESFGVQLREIPSAAGSHNAESHVLADCITTVEQSIEGLEKLMTALDAEVEAASLASALASFRHSWLSGRGTPVDDAERDELAEAAASGHLIVVGRLLGPRDVNKVPCTNLPESVVRRPKSCALLDVAVGAGSVETSKCLLEFHKATPTRETLMMAISSGNLELIRLMWARLPGEHRFRDDLLEVAADFHRDEVTRWLFRDSTISEQELFFVFALEARLADGLLEVLGEGVRPWWRRTRKAAAICREAGEIEFGEPPEGFSVDGGWWDHANQGVRALAAMPNEFWTQEVTEAKLGRVEDVVGVVLPSGVRLVCWYAFKGYTALRSLTIQHGCVGIGNGTWQDFNWAGTMSGCPSLVRVTIPETCTMIGGCAFFGCSGLQQLVIPSSVTEIGYAAFCGCSGLIRLTIPSKVTIIRAYAFRGCSGLVQVTMHSGVTRIGDGVFLGCSRLAQLMIPSSVTEIGYEAFCGCSSLSQLVIPANIAKMGLLFIQVFDGAPVLESLTLVGSPLNPAIVAVVEPALMPGAKVVGAALAGQEFGRFTITAGS
jgi:hypothetical protein